MRIGIFGGCFNPPHKMHYDIANNLIINGYLDKVIFVPTEDAYNKKDLASHKNRVEMLTLMSSNENILVSDICKEGNYKYTYEVLDLYGYEYPDAELYFICGTDNLDWFDQWKRYEYILKKYKLLVIKRNDDNIEAIINKYIKYRDNIKIANMKQSSISSTMIRKYIKEEKLDELKGLVNENVLDYIIKKGLYKK